MKISKGVEMLTISATLPNGPSILHPTIIWDGDNIILVDTGLPDLLPQFLDEFQNAGIPFEKLNKIILTHSDMDHIGGLSSILKELTGKVQVLAHIEEKPYIQCEKPPIRLTQIEAGLKSLQGERLEQMKSLYEKLKANYKNLRADVDIVVADGEELPYCGGIEVVFTPGHTPGHICLYHKESKTLIAGDVLNVENQQLVPAPDFTAIDKNSVLNSLKKLTQYDIATIICYHGGMYNTGVNDRIAEIVNK